MTPQPRQPLLRKTDHSTKIKVAQFGLGPIGLESLRLLGTKSWAKIVGGVDIDPAKSGKTLADLGAGSAEQRINPGFDQLFERAKPDVVIHTAGSKVGPAIEQIASIARAGVSVVSSCEELLFPWHRAHDAAAELDRICQESGARVVATGVNPGFVMDLLPLCLTGVSRRVDSIYAERIVNASTRRMPLQKKIGSGMDPEEFRALFRAGQAGHAGFQESASLIAHTLGWEIEQLMETCEPVIADHDITTKFFSVKRGQTCGLHQMVKVLIAGRERIVLDLKMYLDASNPHDAVTIAGQPPLDVTITGGVAGEDATVAALVNAVPRLLTAPPGLRLITDLPVPAMV
jgi:4-hydroxy-tetrahydrodipicolinate reductase